MRRYLSEKRIRIVYILIIEAILLLCMSIVLLCQYRSRTIVETPLADWKSGYVAYAGDGWYINEQYFEDAGSISPPIEFMFGPDTELPKGTYTVKIQYVAEEDQAVRIGKSDFIQSADAILSKNKTSIDYHITATEDIENFNILFSYNGNGLLGIKAVSIYKNTFGVRKALVCALLLMAMFDGLLLLSTKSNEEKRTFWILFGIVLLSSLPVIRNAIRCDDNTDMMFHLVRIEGISQELRNGIIPVRLSSFWMDGYGYPASVYYGDILLYIPAVLRLFGFSITTSYISYIFFINAGTTVLAYICFGIILGGGKHKKNVTLLTCLAYVTATYRLTNIYVRGAVGEYSAMMFFPIVALAVFLIYTTDHSNWKLYRRNALILAIGMTGLIETHVISVEMAVVSLGLVVIIFWKKTFRLNTLKVYILAVIETMFLNMWFMVPFLDYFINVSIKTNYIDPLINFSLTGVSLPALFSFNTGGAVIMMLTPGMALMAGLITAVCYIYHNGKQSDKQIGVYALFSMIFLFFASSCFPWKHLVKNYEFMKILAQVQFPWRYIGIADVFLSLLLGRLITVYAKMNREDFRRVIWVLSGICVISMLCFTGNLVNADSVRLYDAAELNTSSVVGGEYMLAANGKQAEEKRYLTGKIDSDHMQEASLLWRKGTEMHLYCKTGDMEGSVEVPIFNYKGYHVYDESGRELDIYNGDNFVIGFKVPANFDGEITVQFIEPWYWRAAEVISLISVIVLIVWVCSAYIKRSDRGMMTESMTQVDA